MYAIGAGDASGKRGDLFGGVECCDFQRKPATFWLSHGSSQALSHVLSHVLSHGTRC